MSDTYNKEETMRGTSLEKEYDAIFDGDEKSSALLKLTSNAFTRTFQRIKINQIGLTDPIKKGRAKTMIGLTSTIKDIGVVTPIHVMTVSEEAADDDYRYILLSGLRRMYGALRNGQEEIDAFVWDFHDKDQGTDLALVLSLLLNRVQKRTWGEIWDLYKALELQSSITPNTLEYLLQLESGEAMKLKDVMLCDYAEVKEALVNNEKTLDGAYKMLQKLRKEEDQLAKEDVTGVSDTVEGAEELASDNVGESGQLSDQDVVELLEMADSIDDIEKVDDDDFGSLNQGVDDSQAGGNRHPLDPALKSAVLSRDNFKCRCCGFGGAAALGVLAVHHILPVHTFKVGQRTDYMENLVTLCIRCHILVHLVERGGGKLQMTKEDFESYSEEEQVSLKRCLKYGRIAVEADKRKNMSIEDVRKATTDSIRHPMPGTGLSDNERAYQEAKSRGELNAEE